MIVHVRTHSVGEPGSAWVGACISRGANSNTPPPESLPPLPPRRLPSSALPLVAAGSAQPWGQEGKGLSQAASWPHCMAIRLKFALMGSIFIWACAVLLLGLSFSPAHAQPSGVLPPFTVVGDAIPQPLTAAPGDAARGRSIVANRQVGLCLLCHTGPFPEERFQGNLAPDLAGTGARWSEGQLRLRIVDAGRLNPATIMPSYYRIGGLTQVNAAWQAKPILAAQQIEDVVAFLLTLRN
jgi:sulfur-oxidizing protein SoxX